jgi:hypothetical protein
LLNHLPDVFGLAVKGAAILVVEAKLGCDSDLIANRRERFSDKFFVCIWAVDFSCIEECDPFVVGCANDLDAFDRVCGGSVIGANTPISETSNFPSFRFFILPLPLI